MKRALLLASALAVSLVSVPVAPMAAEDLSAAAKPIVIKLATLAPNGSTWHETLKDMGEQWRLASSGRVVLRIYPGGVAGEERDVIRRIRVGQLHAGLITNNGLGGIAQETLALIIPLLADSRESLDHVFSILTPRLDEVLEEKGFVALNWGDAGWVRFFVPEADPSIEAVQRARLFVWSGDDIAVEIWKRTGFNAVPLSSDDVLPSLQTGMINAFSAPPMVALVKQWFPSTPVMIDLPWAPLIGATIISKRTWNKIPESLRPKLKSIAEDTGVRLRSEVAELERTAITEMQKRGLTVVRPDKAQTKRWHEVIRSAYPAIRGRMVPAEWFDAALQAAADR